MSYQVQPIATEQCNSLSGRVIAETDDIGQAKAAAAAAVETYGAGILDTQTGQIDVGFGFGVAAPDFGCDEE